MKKSRLKLMFHVVLGYPNLEESQRLIAELCRRDIDYLEIQVPFSDPMADGPLITRANQIALAQNVSIKDVIETIHQNAHTMPNLLLMSYFQPVFNVGAAKIFDQLAKAGAYGCIIPDLPIDQVEAALFDRATSQNLVMVPVFSPAMSIERIRKYQAVKPKLVYCTARQGITGTKSNFAQLDYIQTVGQILDCETVLGFGIQDPETLAKLPPYVGGVAIGSKIIDTIEKHDGNITAALDLVDTFIASRNAITSGTITSKEKL